MKNLVIFALSIIFLLGNMSCSSEIGEGVSTNIRQDSIALNNLNEQIQSINNSYIQQDTRGLKKWLRWLIFGVADVGGYFLGDLGGAVAASKLAWDMTKEETNTKISNDATIKENCLNLIDTTSVGYLHNKYSFELLENYGDTLDTMSTSGLAKIVSDLINRDHNYKINPTNVENILKGTRQKFDPNTGIRENIENFKNLTNDELKKATLDICGSVLEGLQYIDDADTTYIPKVTKTIEDSDISPEVKQQLLDGISIANGSALLWNSNQLSERLKNAKNIHN